MSPGCAKALGLQTDDSAKCEVILPSTCRLLCHTCRGTGKLENLFFPAKII